MKTTTPLQKFLHSHNVKYTVGSKIFPNKECLETVLSQRVAKRLRKNIEWVAEGTQDIQGSIDTYFFTPTDLRTLIRLLKNPQQQPKPLGGVIILVDGKWYKFAPDEWRSFLSTCSMAGCSLIEHFPECKFRPSEVIGSAGKYSLKDPNFILYTDFESWEPERLISEFKGL